MTVVVGLVDGGRVIMGADSAGSGDCSTYPMVTPKVFRLGPLLLGYTSAFRFGQVIRYGLIVPRIAPDEDFERYLAGSFSAALRDCLKEHGWHSTDNGRDAGGRLMVAYNGRLAVIEEDYGVIESMNGYRAIGCGSEWATGSLHTTGRVPYNTIVASLRVRLALEAAADHDQHCAGPFVVERLEPAD